MALKDKSIKKTTPTIDSLFKTASKGLSAEFQRIRETMKHHGTAGSETEGILNKFLNDHLPRRFAAASGFAIDTEDQISQQIDTLVYDAENNPVYRAGENFLAQILPSDSIAAAIEIKANLNKKQLKDAAQKIASVKKLKRSPVSNLDQQVNFSKAISVNCLGIVFAYTSSTGLEALANNLQEMNQSIPREQRIDLVVVLDKGIITYVPRVPGENKFKGLIMMPEDANFRIPAWYVDLCIFEEPEHALHYFFMHLMSSIAFFRRRISLPFESFFKNTSNHITPIQTYWFNTNRDLVAVPTDHLAKKQSPLAVFNVFIRETLILVGQFHQYEWSDGYVYRIFSLKVETPAVLDLIVENTGQNNESIIPSSDGISGWTTLLSGSPPSLENIKKLLIHTQFEIRD